MPLYQIGGSYWNPRLKNLCDVCQEEMHPGDERRWCDGCGEAKLDTATDSLLHAMDMAERANEERRERTAA